MPAVMEAVCGDSSHPQQNSRTYCLWSLYKRSVTSPRLVKTMDPKIGFKLLSESVSSGLWLGRTPPGLMKHKGQKRRWNTWSLLKFSIFFYSLTRDSKSHRHGRRPRKTCIDNCEDFNCISIRIGVLLFKWLSLCFSKPICSYSCDVHMWHVPLAVTHNGGAYMAVAVVVPLSAHIKRFRVSRKSVFP